ncbi:hypothetical protein AB6846_18135 [Serratia proteamaculans]
MPVRFIGGDQLEANRPLFAQWINKLQAWKTEGLTPYLFIHTPYCTDAPQQARSLWQQLRQQMPSVQPEPDWPLQDTLF